MKRIIKTAEPPLLEAYRIASPRNKWGHFTKKHGRKKQVQNALKADQGGLCAYCEIDLIDGSSAGGADFRTEHFHPKSDETTAKNWNLDWHNLLGCCHGGSCRNVVDASIRYASSDHSCDVPKGTKILDTIIFNPLNIPAHPVLFKFERSSGEVQVHKANCRSAGVDELKAQQTISELRLDADRLNLFRKRVLDELNIQLQTLAAKGMSIGDAQKRLSQQLLRKDSKDNWPAFFSSIRSYLGAEAEEHLMEAGYDG